MEIQLWRSILCPYELAVKELMVKFEHIIDEHKQNDLYSPIEQVSGRVKSLPSILEKMQRKHIPMEKMEEEIEDIAGIRIICQFEEDIDTVASIIRSRSDMTIKSEKNYLKHRYLHRYVPDARRRAADLCLRHARQPAGHGSRRPHRHAGDVHDRIRKEIGRASCRERV